MLKYTLEVPSMSTNKISFRAEIRNILYETPFLSGAMFVCVEVLWPIQPNGAMSSAVSLPNHMLYWAGLDL